MLERSHAHHHAMHCLHTSAFYFYACDTRVYVCAFVRVCGAFAWSFSYEAAYCPHLPVVVLHFFSVLCFVQHFVLQSVAAQTQHIQNTLSSDYRRFECVRKIAL